MRRVYHRADHKEGLRPKRRAYMRGAPSTSTSGSLPCHSPNYHTTSLWQTWRGMIVAHQPTLMTSLTNRTIKDAAKPNKYNHNFPQPIGSIMIKNERPPQDFGAHTETRRHCGKYYNHQTSLRLYRLLTSLAWSHNNNATLLPLRDGWTPGARCSTLQLLFQPHGTTINIS